MSDTKRLARYFAALISVEFTQSELQEVNRLNALPEYRHVCATHNFRDANAYMYGAFAALFFRPMECESESDCTICNDAWKLARNAGFNPALI